MINRALEKFGGDVALLDTKGQLLVLAGRSGEGMALLTEAVSVQGSDPLLLLHLANAYLAAGKPAEARTTYRRAQVFNVELPTRSGRQIAEFSPSGLNLDRIRQTCDLTPKKPSKD